MDIIDQKDLGIIDGFNVVVYLVPDVDSTPYDADCYSDDDIAAWKRDDWGYVGTIVKASREGIVLGESSLWASEYGVFDGKSISPLDGEGHQFINGYGPDLISEAITEAKANITKLTTNQ
ncbi:hypothetical protein DDJ46_17820 [Mycobacteroides abscessus]|nr:hypothetical protein DDJ46_17820 [Mycobacteroides abscessus]